MADIFIAEDELDVGNRTDTLVHVGVTSCFTISAVMQHMLVGLHVVQFAADNSSYQQRLPGLLAQFNMLVGGQPINRLILVAPLMFYDYGIERRIRQGIHGAPAPLVIDISDSTERGNNVCIRGGQNVVEVVLDGNVIEREAW
ncbi:hypothetical protein SAMN02745857_02891 [Andreprevotia lacus DSM 23236]|jgi:hypothetical protein|uniref:Uncharacterized protein n=1 Tax=Andreprevotia lacus DSM 23236 TaxID=1121001 RepID=A0A1W1XUI1_9NEIS|nr:hypothetical protein [Andreprevotia lacus]SMC27515.1 hypothetical protein SAMN02745857_02891 [Andreprevotia lacus DSM 23236]